MKTVFVPTDDWDSHYESAEEYISFGQGFGECREGEEFELVRLEVGALTRYRVVDGKPVVVSIAFPDRIETEGGQP